MAGGEKGFGGEAGNLKKRLELMEEGKGGGAIERKSNLEGKLRR